MWVALPPFLTAGFWLVEQWILNCLILESFGKGRAGASLGSSKESVDVCRFATLPNCGILVS